MTKRRRRRLIAALALPITLFFAPQLVLVAWSAGQTYAALEDMPGTEYGVVFGAHVAPSGEPSDAARERIEAAIELYHQGGVQRLFISGDNRSNEQADALASYARDRGVAEGDVVVDRLGFDTHDTCRHFAAVAADAVMITQAYHLPRAMYMCQREGVDGSGLAVNRLGLLENRGDSPRAIWTTRLSRFVRESALTWAFLLGIYDDISDEAEQLEAS